jgi:hypothetical protein
VTDPAPTAAFLTRAPGPASRVLIATAWVAAAAYTAVGVGAMLLLSPRVPYADPWRFLVRFLTTPFPENVFAADNGHREVLPNLVRVAELHAFAANQWLQIGCGVVLALAAAAAALAAFAKHQPAVRAAAALLISIGWFWLGNARKLAHGNESVSLFCVLGAVLAGLVALRSAGATASWRGGLIAAACGVVATYSFGAGLAAFLAFTMVLVMARAALVSFVPLLLIAGAALVPLLSGLPSTPGFEWAIGERLDYLLRWLGAPLVWAGSPLLDPEHAARLPCQLVRDMLTPIADAAHAACGPRLAARWPAAAAGGIGLLWLVTATIRHRRRGGDPLERLALGLAWFGTGVGCLVVGLRVGYFRQYPDQLTSARYVPWSVLLWLGLALTLVLRARSARRALWLALAVALLLAPSQVWSARAAHRQRTVAERTAAGVAVGVLPRDFPLVESEEKDVLAAAPLLRAAGAAMFAWPETAVLGRTLAPTALQPVAFTDLAVRKVDNRFPGTGAAVQFHADGVPHDRVLLLGAGDVVCGMATRTPFTSQWHGYLRGESPASLRVAALR